MQLQQHTLLNIFSELRESREKNIQLIMLLLGINWGTNLVGKVMLLNLEWPFTMQGYRQSTCADDDLTKLTDYNIKGSTGSLLYCFGSDVEEVNRQYTFCSHLGVIEIQMTTMPLHSGIINKQMYHRFDPYLKGVINS